VLRVLKIVFLLSSPIIDLNKWSSFDRLYSRFSFLMIWKFYAHSQHGGVVSEAPPGSNADRQKFSAISTIIL
jgi:hypothetical protein